ncbi:NUDIX domain-containing protein [Nocardiopsis dassonvillei]|uniref:NUDIX hydrolase n=1 Tax=Nocardiopsis dassonvillei TaxID=2014 RepID=UPI0033EA654E
MNRDNDGRSSPPLHSVSVAGAVIREDGRMLVIKRRDNGNWEPPGGVLELDESPQEGVVREVLEETGIHVEVEQLTGVYKNIHRGVIALVFRCKPSGGEEGPTPEATAVEWLALDEIKARMSEVYAVRLLDSRTPNNPRVRTSDGKSLIL